MFILNISVFIVADLKVDWRQAPIGVSTVKLIKIDNNKVVVQGLDIIDDTPILDIKPYTPQYDAAADAKVPDWVNKLDY